MLYALCDAAAAFPFSGARFRGPERVRGAGQSATLASVNNLLGACMQKTGRRGGGLGLAVYPARRKKTGFDTLIRTGPSLKPTSRAACGLLERGALRGRSLSYALIDQEQSRPEITVVACVFQ